MANSCRKKFYFSRATKLLVKHYIPAKMLTLIILRNSKMEQEKSEYFPPELFLAEEKCLSESSAMRPYRRKAALRSTIKVAERNCGGADC